MKRLSGSLKSPVPWQQVNLHPPQHMACQVSLVSFRGGFFLTAGQEETCGVICAVWTSDWLVSINVHQCPSPFTSESQADWKQNPQWMGWEVSWWRRRLGGPLCPHDHLKNKLSIGLVHDIYRYKRYIYIYICVYIYMCVSDYMWLHLHTHTYVYVYIYIFINITSVAIIAIIIIVIIYLYNYIQNI